MAATISSRLGRRLLAVLAAVAASVPLVVAGGVLTAPPSAAADPVTYVHDETIPVPPASTYSGSAGGDGWNVALSDTEVFNVFHHQANVQVACHKQVDATECYPPRTITDAQGRSFGASGHSGAFYDAATRHVYVFTVRNDDTAGVVCFDAATAATETNPFCGFTPLTGVGNADDGGSTPYISQPVKVGNRYFAFSWVNTVAPAPTANAALLVDQNSLLCFDITTHAACSGQPFNPSLGGAAIAVGNFPPPPVAAIDGRIIIGFDGSTDDRLTCFDTATNATCAGGWPTGAPAGYVSGAGAPFPRLNASGATTGFCLPYTTAPCYDFAGQSIATPAGLASVITPTSGWNGSAVTLGSRIYVPDGNLDRVACFNAATGASCANFPKDFPNLSLLYTVNPDPARPSCLWINADSGDQINNFDAFTGGGCGQGPIRVLGSSFVAPQAACVPGSYTSLQVLSPPRASYTTGSVAFLDGDANPLPIADRAVDGTGTVSLAGLNLNSAAGLPQFLVSLTGVSPSSVTLRLTWVGERDQACVRPGTQILDNPPNPPNPPVPPTPTTVQGRCHQVQATIRGTDGDDVIFGTPGNDVIVGLDGNDTINGLGGADIICGRAGNDSVVGGPGNDIYLSGGRGRDEVYGNDGDDAVYGRDDDDLVVGGRGNDKVFGNAEDDLVKGGSGNDMVNGGYGDDQVLGNGGKNTLRGGPGKDSCGPLTAKNQRFGC